MATSDDTLPPTENTHKILGARIAKKLYGMINKGYVEICNLILDVKPYGEQFFSSLGSAIIMQTAYDMYEDDQLSKSQFMLLRNDLNKKSYEFVKSTFDIIVESGIITKELLNSTNENVAKFCVQRLIEYFKSNNLEYDEEKWNKIIKKELIDKKIVSLDTPIRTSAKINAKKIVEKEISDKYAQKFGKQIDLTNSNNPDYIKLSGIRTIKELEFEISNKKFINTVEDLHYTGIAISQIGSLTKNKDVVKTGTAIMGVASFATGIGASFGFGSATTLAMGPIGWSTLILGGTIMIAQSLDNPSQNNGIYIILQAQSQLLNQMRVEMHERFNQLLKILNNQQQLYLNKFCKITSNIDTIIEYQKLVNNKIQLLMHKIDSTNTNINEKFVSVMTTITQENIIREKENIIKIIKQISLDTRDNFDENMRFILSNATTLNEIMSGYFDITTNPDRILQRFGKIRHEFNINSCVVIANNICKTNVNCFHFSPEQIINFVKKITVESVDYEYGDYILGIFLNNSLLENLLAKIRESPVIKKKYLFLINNFGIWSLLIYDIVLNNYEYIGRNIDFIKNIIMSNISNVKFNNLFEKTKKIKFTDQTFEILNYINEKCNPVKLTKIQLIELIRNSENKFNIGQLQNPVLFCVFLNIIIEKINAQKNPEGNFPTGCISIPLYRQLITLTHKIVDYYDFISFCRDDNIYKTMFDNFVLEQRNVKSEITKYYIRNFESEFELLSIQLKELYRTNTCALIEIFANQTIPIGMDYHYLWFKDESHHTHGKFCTQSRTTTVHSDHSKNYRDHMTSQITHHINHALEQTRNALAQINQTNDYILINNNQMHNLKVPKIIPEFMQCLNYSGPMLKTSNLMKSSKFIPDNVFILQFLNPKNYEIIFKYRIANGKFYIFTICNTCIIIINEILFEPLFYKGDEAIFWFWYGGNINMNGSCKTLYRTDTSLENVWVHTMWIPEYTTRKPVDIEKFTQVHLSKSTDNMLKFYLMQKIYLKFNENIKHDLTLQKHFNKLDTAYYTICEFLSNTYANVDISKIFTTQYNNSKQINALIEKSKDNMLDFNTIVINELIKKYGDIVLNSDDIRQKIYEELYELSSNIENTTNLLEINNQIIIQSENLITEKILNNGNPNTDSNDMEIKSNSNWLELFDTKNRFCYLMKEIECVVTERFSASEKMDFNREVTNTLLKIIEIIQTNPVELRGFDVSGFVNATTQEFNEKIRNGIKCNYKEHLKKCILTLSANQQIPMLKLI